MKKYRIAIVVGILLGLIITCGCSRNTSGKRSVVKDCDPYTVGQEANIAHANTNDQKQMVIIYYTEDRDGNITEYGSSKPEGVSCKFKYVLQ